MCDSFREFGRRRCSSFKTDSRSHFQASPCCSSLTRISISIFTAVIWCKDIVNLEVEITVLTEWGCEFLWPPVNRLSRLACVTQTILRANIKLATEVEIGKYIICRLQEAVKIERRRHKKGKRLNLLGKEDVGPQFLSLLQVQSPRLFQAQKEAMSKQIGSELLTRRLRL